ncbi:MAG: Ig-like domain-containing protein, partial [Thermoplasmatota archaeon]
TYSLALQQNRTYHWRIVAWDGKGSKNESSAWQFTTTCASSGNSPPEIGITKPLDGSTISGMATVAGTAWDADGNETISCVEIKIDDGNWTMATGTEKWAYTLNMSALKEGDHLIQARAYDNTSYSAVAQVNVSIKQSDTPGFTLLFYIIATSLVMIAYIAKKQRGRS